MRTENFAFTLVVSGDFAYTPNLMHFVVEGWLGSGHHEEVWNGRDATGRPVPSGQYLIRLKTQNRTDIQKVILAK